MSIGKKTARCMLTVFGLLVCASKEYRADLKSGLLELKGRYRGSYRGSCYDGTSRRHYSDVSQRSGFSGRGGSFQGERYGEDVMQAVLGFKKFLQSCEDDSSELAQGSVASGGYGSLYADVHIDMDHFYVPVATMESLVPALERKAFLVCLKDMGCLSESHSMVGEMHNDRLTYKISKMILKQQGLL